MPSAKESFGEVSFNTDPSNGTFAQIPWYVEKNFQNVDLSASRRSRISTNSNFAWTVNTLPQQNQPKMSQTQIEPEYYNDVSST